MSDMIMDAGDGTQRVIESEAIRALVGYVEQRERLFHRPCSALPDGHRHCVHGHTEDCPKPDDCELLDETG